MSNEDRINAVKKFGDILNEVSPTFCLAKWLQVTTNLYNGTTHSCHHPSSHKISEESVLKTPNSLHNTPIKIYAREEMLKGIQTRECQYCWNVENLPEKTISDRLYKSNNSWARPYLDKVLRAGNGENINPTYMEIAFENVCNFKCTYCTPDVSSRWMEEIQSHGAYKLNGHELHNLEYLKKTGKFPIHHKEYNPYIEAFWKWWPDLYKDLHTFRITGGEPLLSENTWKVLEYIKSNPRPNLTLSINTNMGVPHNLIIKLVDVINTLIKNKMVKELMIFTSAESIEKQCEYIRYGMDWNLYNQNIEYFLSNTDERITLHVMTTINILSCPGLEGFLKWVINLREKYNKSNSHNRIGFNLSYLRFPQFITLTQLTTDLKSLYSETWKKFAIENSDSSHLGTLYLEEVDQINRLCGFMNSKTEDKNLMKDFYLYYTEADKRRKTNFNLTFPELVGYMETCENTFR